ncbi:MAG: HEPN domain-containing protein [Candidatus Woesebacteria bacterium]|nr:MAG: HEPN domain-containing protein [Candidatus Woesebacteria bacterium]
MNNIKRSELLFTAADECVNHAQSSFERNAWNMSIRRSQEAVELELSAILALIGIHYPKDHDQAPLAIRTLKAHDFDLGQDAEKIERISIDLSRKRGPALHQEEGYEKDDAQKALDDANFVISKIQKVRGELLQKINK